MASYIKKLASNLKKSEVALTQSYKNWYRLVEGEIRLFINETSIHDKEKLENVVDWKNNKADLCISDLESAEKFYEENKEYKVRFFIKPYSVDLYSEYAVKSWGMKNTGLELIFE